MDDDADRIPSLARSKPTNSGRRAPTVPIASLPGNHFLRGDNQQYTREEWADRRVALITGITGQDGSYLAERECEHQREGVRVPDISASCISFFSFLFFMFPQAKPVAGPVVTVGDYPRQPPHIDEFDEGRVPNAKCCAVAAYLSV
jgi:hypothetical protein